MCELFRVATWNLDRPTPSSWLKNPARQAVIESAGADRKGADLWVLTETSSVIEVPGYDHVATPVADNVRYPAQNYTTIWSKYPIIKRDIPVYDRELAVCAEIASPFGPMIVYGTIITYANDGVGSGFRRWEKHRQSVRDHAKDWRRIRQQYPDHHFCIAGDFNQSRDDSGWYEDREAVEMLTETLAELSLACMTAGDLNLRRRSSVDHICLSASLADAVVTVGAWEGTDEKEVKMSDHNGVYVDLELNFEGQGEGSEYLR